MIHNVQPTIYAMFCMAVSPPHLGAGECHPPLSTLVLESVTPTLVLESVTPHPGAGECQPPPWG